MIKDILILPAIFFGDLAIKMKAEKSLSCGTQYPLLNDGIRIKLLHNKGAMLGTGENEPERVVHISAALCTALSIVFIISLFSRRLSKFRTALSMLLGGAWSNAYDRLTRGYVVDYVSFPLLGKTVSRLFGKKAGSYVSGIVFNISDFFIFAGCLLTAVLA